MDNTEPVGNDPEQGVAERRLIRSKYLAIKTKISDRKDEIVAPESEKLTSIVKEMDNLHRSVEKPREQVADAETLLDIANSLVTCFKSHTSGGVTPSDFVAALLRNFGFGNQMATASSVSWPDLGAAVSAIFKRASGCCTMVGPMKSEIKERASAIRSRSRTPKPSFTVRPEEISKNDEDEKSSTDKNMLMMFEILRKKRGVRLEYLVLNRLSFAQTIENIFSLSFLVKEGRVEITLNDSGHHIVLPRNAPSASAVSSGKAHYNHFVFRFDYSDWKLMCETVKSGEELMPNRCSNDSTAISESCSTPVKKLSKHQGLVIAMQSMDNAAGASSTPKKRKDA